MRDVAHIMKLFFNKMEETFQSNTLEWSSLVFIILSFLFFSTTDFLQRFFRHFSTDFDKNWHMDSP